MGISLITGETGIEHVRSFHDAALYASIAGEGEYALDELGAPTASLTSSNKVHVNAGNLLMQGHHIYIDSAGVDVNITTGSQGEKRNILIVATYEMDDDGIESVKLEAVYGTETTGTPADPAITHGDIVTTGARALKNQMPLFRVAQNGITPSEPVAVFENLKSYSKYWDSVSQNSGTDGGWTWAKRPDGTAECWGTFKVTQTNYENLGGGWTYSTSFDGTAAPWAKAFPAGLFSEKPTVSVGVEANRYAFASPSSQTGAAQVAVGVAAYGILSDMTLHVRASGRHTP